MLVNNMEKAIYSETTELKEIEKLDAIREYVYTNSVLANDDELLLNAFSPEIFGLTKKEKVVKMFNLTSNYKGGLYCDGFADQLAMFYQLLGYKAYRVNLNVYGNTHCVTIVKCNEEWIIQDATFNCSYVLGKEDRNIENIIYNLKNEMGQDVNTLEGEIKNTYAISKMNSDNWKSMYPLVQLINEKDDKYLYVIDRTVSHYSMYELMYPYFISDGYRGEYRFSLLYVDNIIWKFGIEDFIFARNDRLQDVNEVKKILMK